MKSLAAIVLLCAGALAGCNDISTDSVAVTRWELDPQPPGVGVPTRAAVVLRDAHGPVRGARLEVEAHMAHAGMTPVVVTTEEHDAGMYEGSIRFTMSGRWTLVASATMPDGTRVTRPLGATDVP